MKLITPSVVLLFVMHFQKAWTQDEFMIGTFGVRHSIIDAFPEGVPTSPTYMGYNTSHLNVLKEDGFNIVTGYKPDLYVNYQFMKSWLDLCQANNMLYMTALNDWYIPDSLDWYWGDIDDEPVRVANSNDGENVYDSPYGDRPNYDFFFDTLYSKAPYSSIIWGHEIIEESVQFNTRSYNHEPLGFEADNRIETEVPLYHLSNAIDHFIGKLVEHGITHQKIVDMEANHFGAINENLIYDEENNDTLNHYTAKHTLENIPKNTVFFEGSYNYFRPGEWYFDRYEDDIIESGTPSDGNYLRHFLGTFESITYAKSKVDEVQDVIGLRYNVAGDYTFHSDPSKKNANWFWFRTYTSIIHGSDGIWFWDLLGLYPSGVFPASYADHDLTPDAFERTMFPTYYNEFVAPLTKELRYLSNEGFLISGADDNVLYRKLGHVDNHCIVPPATDYIPKYSDLPEALKDSIGLLGGWNGEFRGDNAEFYGLRYTIRTNGEDVIMIISNPLPIEIHDVLLDFSEISNEVIQNANGVDILFNDGVAIGSAFYKTDRDAGVDLGAGTYTDFQYQSMGVDHTLELDFGPSDVHVLKFKTDPLPDYDNGWELVWSNYGSGRIGDWGDINEEDKFFPGDFNGDGEDELLIVQSYDDPAFTWMTLLKYNYSGGWDVLWTNSGALHPMLPYREYLQVGDFDGDGTDECLGNAPGELLRTFHFTGSDWVVGWTEPLGHAIEPYKNKLIVGDYNGDGKDELLGWDSDGSNWKTMFRFNGSSWVWMWSEYGAGSPIDGFLIETYVADYDGDGKDELLGIQKMPPLPDGDAVLFKFLGSSWYPFWTTGGGASFGGWTYPIPPTDRVVVGDIDNVDSKDEIMFISTGPTASWSTSMDLKSNLAGWNWNWSANPDYSVPYIDNWPIADGIGSKTGYFLMQPEITQPNYLMAVRKFGCQTGYKYYVSMYRSIFGSNKAPEKVEIGYQEVIENQHEEIEQVEPYPFSVFPNPNKGTFDINYHLTETDDVTMRIFDVKGKLVYEWNNNNILEGNHRVTVSLGNIDKGVYILNFVGKYGVTSKKIVIN